MKILVDFQREGNFFATAGKDTKVRIYDEHTRKIVSTHSGGQPEICAGHVNRIFSLKWTTDSNIIISGGWDNTLQFWDPRVSHSIRSIYG